MCVYGLNTAVERRRSKFQLFPSLFLFSFSGDCYSIKIILKLYAQVRYVL